MSVKAKKQSRPQKQSKAKPVAQAEIKFDDAVIMGRTFVAHIKLNEWELGRLADCVEKKYGKGTLAKLAEEINFPLARLSRCRSTYRAYKGADFKGTTPNFAPAQALQAHPDRVNILIAKPEMPTPEARGIARAAKKGKKPPKSRNDAGFIRATLEFAQKVHSEIGHVTPAHIDADILRDGLDNPAQADAMLRRAGQDFFNLADMWKEVLARQPAPTAQPEPMFNDDTPGEATREAAE